MTGCYSNADPEDRARERELNRHLDILGESDRREEHIESRVAELWETLASPYSAEKLDNDWEITLPISAAMLTSLAYAKQTGEAEFLLASLTGMVDARLKAIAITEEDKRHG